jgi:hypothetical protein
MKQRTTTATTTTVAAAAREARAMPKPMQTNESKVDKVEKAIRKRLESMTGFADEATQALKLSTHFKKFDTNRSGKICKREFEEAMVGMNFVGCQMEIRQLFDRYDVDSSGSLTYQEFVEEVVGLKANPKGDPLSRSLLERIRARVIERGKKTAIRAASAPWVVSTMSWTPTSQIAFPMASSRRV